MRPADLHVHTTFSDGENTPEEMVRAAIRLGMKTIGFSDHSYTFFDESYCMRKSEIGRYRDCIAELRTRYAGEIEILCGIEQDYYSAESCDGYDYVIGSVHYVKSGRRYIPVDESPELLLSAVRDDFGGDVYRLIGEYYRTVAAAGTAKADIIGHFDLIAKFNENGALFDEADPRYIAAARDAADRLLETGRPFEINTGAIARGWRSVPYPSKALADYIRERGGRFILSSDSHAADTLCFRFDDPYAQAAG